MSLRNKLKENLKNKLPPLEIDYKKGMNLLIFILLEDSQKDSSPLKSVSNTARSVHEEVKENKIHVIIKPKLKATIKAISQHVSPINRVPKSNKVEHLRVSAQSTTNDNSKCRFLHFKGQFSVF